VNRMTPGGADAPSTVCPGRLKEGSTMLEVLFAASKSVDNVGFCLQRDKDSRVSLVSPSQVITRVSAVSHAVGHLRGLMF
jgi:hypothetical protein